MTRRPRAWWWRITFSGAVAATALVATPAWAQNLDTLTTSFDVDGVRVILRRNSGNNVVAASLYLLGGTRQATDANAGIEPFLLTVSERGTRNYPKADLRRKMSLLGSEIVVAPSVDWTLIGARTTTERLDSTWAILADRVTNPALQPAEVEIVRTQLISGARQRRDDPDELVNYLADSIAFAGHPYSRSVTGTPQSLAAITAPQLRAYQQTQMVKSRMLLVVVGDVERAKVERLVRGTLARLPVGTYSWTLPQVVPELPGAAVIERRALPTNYILGYYAGPPASGADYPALRVAASVLSGRMFAVIRSQLNLTYDVRAPFLDRAATAGGLYVTTVAPDSTLRLMRGFVAELKRELVVEDGLKRLEQEFITEYFIDNETNALQADFLAREQLYQGDYRRADRFVAELRAVNAADVQRVARKYMDGFRFAYVGDPAKVDRRLLTGF